MVLFEYLYFRMFKAYEAKNDSPYMRTFMYLTLVKFIIACVILVYLEGILEKVNIIHNLNKDWRLSFLILAGVIIIFSTYWMYSRKDIEYFESKFDNLKKLNRLIKIWILIATPFLFFFGMLFLYVILFGGEILGDPIKGLLN